MLDFWLLQPDEKVEIIESCLEGDIDRPADFQIDIDAFHLAFNNGLENLAIEIGFSYFEDALLTPASCLL